jgi:metallophosphoesterase (TIGR00282 family)
MQTKILTIGDICGRAGVAVLSRRLWSLRKYYGADMVVVNGENAAASGRGLMPADAREIFGAGADVITLGNHGLDRREIADYLDDTRNIIRPANWSSSAPGAGYTIFDTGKARVCVINLIGRVGMGIFDSPFDTADRIIERCRADADAFVVDFHAEATSEKYAMAYHLDGRAAVLFGTHTHVQTADEHIFPGGLGYITDIGMTGAADSVIGVKWEQSLAHFRGDMLVRFEQSEREPRVCGALFTVQDGKCVSAELVNAE